MTRSRCNLFFFYGAQESLGRRLPWFGASKMTPSGSRVIQLQPKTVFKTNYEPCLLCGVFYAHLSSNTTTTPQGFDMSLLWVYRGHVMLANALLEGTLTQFGLTNGFCVLVTVVSLRISMVNFYPRPRHTREGDRNLNPQNIILGPMFCLQV